jgi:hypothetical protein
LNIFVLSFWPPFSVSNFPALETCNVGKEREKEREREREREIEERERKGFTRIRTDLESDAIIA